MATSPRTTTPNRWRLRTITATVTASAVMVLTACTGPAEGTITENPSPTPEQMFALEIQEDSCPDADLIPDEFAAPDEIGYTIDYAYQENRLQVRQTCLYQFDDDFVILDGTQAAISISVSFNIQDEPVTGIVSASDYEPVDFEEVKTAEYFKGWDHLLTSRNDMSGYADSVLEHSERELIDVFAAIGNLAIHSSMSLVMIDDDHDGIPDLDVIEAALQILEAFAAAVVPDLERG